MVSFKLYLIFNFLELFPDGCPNKPPYSGSPWKRGPPPSPTRAYGWPPTQSGDAWRRPNDAKTTHLAGRDTGSDSPPTAAASCPASALQGPNGAQGSHPPGHGKCKYIHESVERVKKSRFNSPYSSVFLKLMLLHHLEFYNLLNVE